MDKLGYLLILIGFCMSFPSLAVLIAGILGGGNGDEILDGILFLVIGIVLMIVGVLIIK